MKPPIKSFTVEVKRSRSTSSAAKPNESKMPLFAEPRSAPGPVPLSQARQLAERMFTSLTAGSCVGPETKLTAESVFGAGAPPTTMVETPMTETAEIPAGPLDPQVEGMVPTHQPPKPRAGKAPASIVPSTKVVKPKASAAIKPAVHVAPAHPHSNVRKKESVPPLFPVKIDLINAASQATVAELQGLQNWGWGPGERWKRRLRYLR